MITTIATLILLTAIYGLIIYGLYLLITRLRLVDDRAVLLAFLLFGLLSGLLVWAWPYDSAAYPNIYAMLIGDELYGVATQIWGDANSPSPHTDIPWLFRTPQIYLGAAVLLCGIVGQVLQIIVKRKSSP